MTWKDADCKAYGCGREANPGITALPLCYEHGLEIAVLYEVTVVKLHDQRVADQETHAVEVQATKRGNREPSVVYYARIGDYIKIGFTTRLRNRLNTLRVDELLAIEPGGPELERERHQGFGVDRIDLRRENFRPSAQLRDHIETLRAQHPLPHWASLPRTTTITRSHQEAE